MAILGYCPGTMPVSLGQGSLDALWGFSGGLLASYFYTRLSPIIHNAMGPDLGQLSLSSSIENESLNYFLVFIIGSAFIGISFWLNKLEKKHDIKWSEFRTIV